MVSGDCLSVWERQRVESRMHPKVICHLHFTTKTPNGPEGSSLPDHYHSTISYPILHPKHLLTRFTALVVSQDHLEQYLNFPIGSKRWIKITNPSQTLITRP